MSGLARFWMEVVPRSPLATAAAAVFAVVLGVLLTPYMAAATLSYFCLLAGVLLRKNREVHMRLMMTGILADLSIVAALQIQRSAIQTAVGGTLSPLQLCHVLASSTATVFYVPVLLLGLKRAAGKGGSGSRTAHVVCGVAAFAFRTAGFLLMFALLGRHGHA